MQQQRQYDQQCSHNNISEYDSAQLLLQKPIIGLFLQLRNDAKAPVALVDEIEKLRGHVSMFPRLTSTALLHPSLLTLPVWNWGPEPLEGFSFLH